MLKLLKTFKNNEKCKHEDVKTWKKERGDYHQWQTTGLHPISRDIC